MGRTSGETQPAVSSRVTTRQVAPLAFSARRVADGLVGHGLVPHSLLARGLVMTGLVMVGLAAPEMSYAADEPAKSTVKTADQSAGAKVDGPTAPDQLFKKLDTNSDGKIEKNEVPDAHRSLFDRLMRVGDADGNGSLDRGEFAAGLKPKGAPAQPITGKIADRVGPDVDPNNIFQVMDKNGDGKLVRDELPEQARERLGRMFDRLNTDEISKEEFLTQFKRMQEMMAAGESPEKMAKMAQSPKINAKKTGKSAKKKKTNPADKSDANKDEANKDEADKDEEGKGNEDSKPAGGPDAAQRAMMFKRADKNGDGKIDKSEAPARLKPMFDRIDKNGDGAISEDELPSRPAGGAKPGASNEKRAKKPVVQIDTIKSPVLNVTALANVSDRTLAAKKGSPNGRKLLMAKGQRGVQTKFVRGGKRGGKGPGAGKGPGGKGKGGIGGKGPGGKGPGGKGPGGKGQGGKGPGGKGPGGKGPGGKGQGKN